MKEVRENAVLLEEFVLGFFTGAPTDKAIWMLIGGIVAASVGLLSLHGRNV